MKSLYECQLEKEKESRELLARGPVDALEKRILDDEITRLTCKIMFVKLEPSELQTECIKLNACCERFKQLH